MVVTKVNENNNLTIKLNGRLDSSSSYLLDEEIALIPTTCEKLILDLKDLEYVSSAGLRVILKLKKVMDRISSLEVINANELVLEVFEITGFDAVLNIKR